MLLLLLLTAAALGGYYLGHLPGSPDVFSWAQDGYNRAANAGKVIVGAANDDSGNLTVTVDGKRYALVAEVAPASAKSSD